MNEICVPIYCFSFADDALARCLYALEMAWHPSFSPATGHTRMQNTAENKPLFRALFLWVASMR